MVNVARTALQATALTLSNAVLRIFILGVRAATPLACFVVLRNFAAVVHGFGRAGSSGRLLWRVVSSWSLAEACFWVYVLRCRRHFNAQTTRKWQAVASHATEERRKSSMDRYLLALTQVCDAGAGDAPPMGAAKAGAVGSGPLTAALGVQKSTHGSGSGAPPEQQRRTGSVGGVAGMLGKKLSQKSMGSVNDLLKGWGNDGSGHGVSSDALRSLKWLELATWFTGPDCGDSEDIESWLQQGNIEEWIAHYWFRGATPDELKTRPREYEELLRLLDTVLDFNGLAGRLAGGRNSHIKPHRVYTDPLPTMHRPLLVYVGAAVLCPLLTSNVMRFLGFSRESIGGLSYWKRPPIGGVRPDVDLAGPLRVPLVFVHGLGVGLVPYYLFIWRLSQRHSGDLYVPEFPFFSMSPFELVPSAREIVAQLQDMLAANQHTAAHFAGHSFGCVVIGWVLKMSPSSVFYVTLMEPALFLMMKADVLTKVLHGQATTPYEIFVQFFGFRELFTVNLVCRNCHWEQALMWPEDLHTPAIIELAGDDHIVQSHFVWRLLEHERAARKRLRRKIGTGVAAPLTATGSSVDVRTELLQKTGAVCPLEIQWCDGFLHGQILIDTRATEKLLWRMRQMVHPEDNAAAGARSQQVAPRRSK